MHSTAVRIIKRNQNVNYQVQTSQLTVLSLLPVTTSVFPEAETQVSIQTTISVWPAST